MNDKFWFDDECQSTYHDKQEAYEFIFGVDSVLPPICMDNEMVTNDPLAKAEVLSTSFLRKQSGQVLPLLSTCFPLPKSNFFAFRSSEVKYYLNDLDSSGSSDPIRYSRP